MKDSQTSSALDRAAVRHLRRIAHHLDPVVLVGEQGISEAVVAEAGRALADHELIKVKIHAGDRDVRRELAEALATATGSEIVQSIGKVWVLFKRNPEPDPKLSNLTRYSAA